MQSSKQTNIHSTNMGGEQSLATNIYPEASPRPIIKSVAAKAAQIPDDTLPSRYRLRPLLLGSRNHSTDALTETGEGKTFEVFKPKVSITPSHGTPPTSTAPEKLNPAQPQGKQSESLGPSIEDEHSSCTLSTRSLPPDWIPASPTAQIPDHMHSQTAVFEHVITNFKQQSAANLIASNGRPGFLDRKLSPHYLWQSHFRVLKP